MIRWFTKSKVSHSFLLVSDPVLGEIVVQQDWGGLQVRSRREFERDSQIVALVDAKVDLTAAVRMAADDFGTPYDFVGLLGEIWVMVGRWLKQSWRNPIASPKEMICSRFVATMMQDAGWPGAEALDATSIDPGALLVFASK